MNKLKSHQIALHRNMLILVVLFLARINVHAQTGLDNPLKAFDYYMGVWLLPSDHPAIKRNSKLSDLQVINFRFGDNHKLIHSTTGIASENKSSEGIISVNPRTKKLVWLEYQYNGNLLFEGEYIPLEKGSLQRRYTVHYPEGDKTIPHPKEEGWTRLYRETFVPISADTIDWITETYIGGKWIQAGTPGGSSAVRKK